MKLILLFLLLSVSVSHAQQKTWGGNATDIRPNQGTNTLTLSTGDATATINHLNALDADTRYLQLQFTGTNQAFFGEFGNLWIGQDPIGTWGSFDQNLSVVAARRADLGEPNAGLLIMTANDAVFDEFSYLYTDTSSSDVQVLIEAGGTTWGSIVGLSSSETAAALSITTDGNQKTVINPRAAEPYRLDTSATQTTGPILSVQNNTTNRFVVTFDGKIKTVPAVTVAGEWRLGTIITNSAVTVITDSYVEISIGGQVLKLAIVQ